MKTLYLLPLLLLLTACGESEALQNSVYVAPEYTKEMRADMDALVMEVQ